MRKNMHIFLLFLLIISTNIAFGTGANKTKLSNGHFHAKHNTRPVAKGERLKRSLDDEDQPLYPQRGIKSHPKHFTRDDSEEYNGLIENNLPFWGNRGRRDSSSMESEEYSAPDIGKLKLCKNCNAADTLMDVYGNSIKFRRDELPFWGNRGRRSSEEVDETAGGPFWGNRGRRQDSKEEPFWGTRGRRQDDTPFWGNRGRREEEPFWGNRGRRDDEPFWGNRGRREDEPFWGNRGRREDAPFWGNRGRRDKLEPFWGNRGRRQEPDPFWGNRGRRDDIELYWGNRGRKQDLKQSILEAINDVQGDIENLSRLRRSEPQTSFWSNRPRESQLRNLFSGSMRTRFQNVPNYLKNSKTNSKEPGTVLDNRIYAEEPHYILVDRSSRSSAEDDPYFISRGKKYNLDLSKAARGRRGAIEEIVKSVRNDPYYIARGKKDDLSKTNNNGTAFHDEFVKAKELICSTIELIMMKQEGGKTKREVNDNERDRRTILKKLAAQLQMDPYFVSRGKKSKTGDDTLEDFIMDVAAKCN